MDISHSSVMTFLIVVMVMEYLPDNGDERVDPNAPGDQQQIVIIIIITDLRVGIKEIAA